MCRGGGGSNLVLVLSSGTDRLDQFMYKLQRAALDSSLLFTACCEMRHAD